MISNFVLWEAISIVLGCTRKYKKTKPYTLYKADVVIDHTWGRKRNDWYEHTYISSNSLVFSYLYGFSYVLGSTNGREENTIFDAIDGIIEGFIRPFTSWNQIKPYSHETYALQGIRNMITPYFHRLCLWNELKVNESHWNYNVWLIFSIWVPLFRRRFLSKHENICSFRNEGCKWVWKHLFWSEWCNEEIQGLGTTDPTVFCRASDEMVVLDSTSHSGWAFPCLLLR